MGIIDKIESEQLRDVTSFRPGDTVRVHVRIREGDKERIQIFEGVVIARRSNGTRAAFTVRKVSYGIGVERVFPLHSPSVEKIEVISSGKVRRAKLYFLRQRRGKAARLKERENWRRAAQAKAKAKAIAAPPPAAVAMSASADEAPAS